MSDKAKRWKGLLGRPVEEMSEATSLAFMSLAVSETKGEKGKVRMEEMEKTLHDVSFVYKVLKKRLEVCKSHVNPSVDVSTAVQMFCSLLCDNPAEAVMWAYTLNEISTTEGARVDMEKLSEKFPNGFPSKEEMRKAWDEQKTSPESSRMSDNMVDDFKTWAYVEKAGG